MTTRGSRNGSSDAGAATVAGCRRSRRSHAWSRRTKGGGRGGPGATEGSRSPGCSSSRESCCAPIRRRCHCLSFQAWAVQGNLTMSRSRIPVRPPRRPSPRGPSPSAGPPSPWTGRGGPRGGSGVDASGDCLADRHGHGHGCQGAACSCWPPAARPAPPRPTPGAARWHWRGDASSLATATHDHLDCHLRFASGLSSG